jgi:hypothetical protein
MAIPNGLNPNVTSISFKNTTSFITGGAATGTTAITAEVGAAVNGAVYLSQSGNGELWFGLAGVWTKLTIN